MDEHNPSEKDTLTQETHERFALPWMNNLMENYTFLEHYTPFSCKGKICSKMEILWTLCSSNGMECSDPH